MDLVNIMYKYINRMINSEDLIKMLESIDLSKFSLKEKESIKKLIVDVKEIQQTIPNEKDKVEIKRISNLNKMIESVEKTLNDENNLNEELENFLKERYDSWLKEKELVKDGGKLYESIFRLLTKHPLVEKYAKSMNDLELLKFIAQYISVPLPPEITQSDFDDLVFAGIKKDEREALWRLAFNYNRKNKDFSKIEDYFIEIRDDYYLNELISAVEDDLDMNTLTDKIIKTKDKDFIKKIIDCPYISFSDENKEKLEISIAD